LRHFEEVGWLSALEAWRGQWVSGSRAEEENASSATAYIRFREVGSVAVYMEVHVAGMISYDDIWMGRGIIDELCEGLSCGLGAIGLF
jgi:hypothetical protein